MKSFVHGLGGGIGRVIGRIVGLIVVGIIGYYIFSAFDIDLWSFVKSRILMDAKAQIQTMTQTIYSPSFSPCGAAGSSNYCVYTTSNTYIKRSLNTTYNGVLKGITFSFNQNLSQGDIYTFTITAMGNDFRNNDFEVLYYASNNSTSQGSQQGLGYRFVSKNKIQVMISRNTYSYHTFIIDGNPLTGDTNYGIKNVTVQWDDGTQDNSDIINSNTENTTDIINNANSNTQDIINSVSGLFQDCYENILNKSSYTLTDNNYRYNVDFVEGQVYTIISNENFGYKISNATWGYADNQSGGINNNVYSFTYQKNSNNTGQRGLFVWFTGNVSGQDLTNKEIMVLKGSVPRVSSYVDYQQKVCSNKIEEETWWMQEIKNSSDETNQTLKDSNVDSGTGADFFNDFSNNDHGLSSIITLPLTTIQSLTSTQCIQLELPVPFTNGTITLPCMREIYQSKVSGLYNLWQVVCYGLIGYWIGLDIFKLVKGFKDPDSDKVEVVDL